MGNVPLLKIAWGNWEVLDSAWMTWDAPVLFITPVYALLCWVYCKIYNTVPHFLPYLAVSTTDFNLVKKGVA